MLAEIYLGHIHYWDNPTIKKINKGVNLPHERVVPIFRSDSSGTSYNFTDYLSHVSKTWKSRVGKGTQPSFPSGVGAAKSSGVAAKLNTNVTYNALFHRAFKEDATTDNIPNRGVGTGNGIHALSQRASPARIPGTAPMSWKRSRSSRLGAGGVTTTTPGGTSCGAVSPGIGATASAIRPQTPASVVTVVDAAQKRPITATP